MILLQSLVQLCIVSFGYVSEYLKSVRVFEDISEEH